MTEFTNFHHFLILEVFFFFQAEDGIRDQSRVEKSQERGIRGKKERKKRMSLMRSLLLAASQNRWLRDHATHYSFVRDTVSRFMPGETLDDALGAAAALRSKKIETVFTHLGENVKNRDEAQQVAEHY